MLDIIKLEEQFNNYYGQGIENLAKGKYKDAKRCLSNALNKMLEVAKCCTGALQSQKIKRAEDILLLLNKIAKTEKINEKIGQVEGETMKTKFMPVEKTGVKLDDVAGLENVKSEIKKKIIFPMKYPDLYKKFNKSSGGGILLYGVPGTGKTMIAKAIANEIDAKFYSVKCSDIVSKWLGQSEQNIKALFDEARSNPYSIIFFDEFEALASKRSDHNNASKMIVPEFLSEMQGFEDSKNTLLCIAATNRPWDIDTAFLRPGRFDTQIMVSLPDDESRKMIVSNSLKNVPIENNFNIDNVVDATKGFNGADVVEFCDSLKDLAIDRSIDLGYPSAIRNEDIEETRSIISSSVRTLDLQKMNKYCSDYQRY